MKNENGVTYQVLVLIIIIIIAIAGVLINKIIGRGGMVNKAVNVEKEYSKEDVVEKMNYIVTQNFIEINNKAKENNQSISELYNSTVVIEYLKQNFIISEYHDNEGNFVENVYDIDVSKLKDDDIMIDGNFRLEKREEKYIIVYYDSENKSQDIGQLLIQQT